jgi:DNA-binding NarL/FixJ family response regulator
MIAAEERSLPPREAKAWQKEGKMSIGLLLADDSSVARHAIRRLLEEEPNIELVAEAVCFADVIRMAAELKPDVVLIDLHMRDEREFDPASTKSHLLGCAKRILAMSVWVDEVSRALAADYGAAKLLDKSRLASELIPAIVQGRLTTTLFPDSGRIGRHYLRASAKFRST